MLVGSKVIWGPMLSIICKFLKYQITPVIGQILTKLGLKREEGETHYDYHLVF